MTDNDTRETLSDVNHTNPYTDRPFGETQTYGRGKVVAADGGAADAAPDEEDDPVADGGGPNEARRASSEERDESSGEAPEETLGDVDHTPPGDTEGAHRAYERGHEGKDDVR